MKLHFKEGWELTLCCVMTMFIRGFQIIWNGGFSVGENKTKYVNYFIIEVENNSIYSYQYEVEN